MKILIVNKFLYPNGGSETYIFMLGEGLRANGHAVQYFGMEHPGRCVGNDTGAYTADMDFHGGGKLAKLIYPFKTIYSVEARQKIRLVLENFAPDVVHLNNFNYQLTPSILLEIRGWEKQTGHRVRIVFTAHDYQLICPNHMLCNPVRGGNCERCIGDKFFHCALGRCIHGSVMKSAVGTLEGYYWNARQVYRQLDAVICPTRFMKTKMDTNPVLAPKTVVMLNFVEPVWQPGTGKKPYVLYFGRFSAEKGIQTLITVCRELKEIQFVFAGSGPLESAIGEVPNIRNAGFQQGEALAKLISEALFSVYPSEWYENCPFSVMESQQYGTPVLGAAIGGIPELIQVGKTGEVFECGNPRALRDAIASLYGDPKRLEAYSRNCETVPFDTPQSYYGKLMRVYRGH
jgi:glycosyltransferase involved in cell wall biosynthesis